MTLFPVCVLTALSLVPTFVPGQGASRDTLAQMRFFGGMSIEETATALAVSRDTVLRDWRLAKVWLLREIRRRPGDVA